MKNKAINIGIFASVLPHILCCGLPIVLSVVSLVAPDVAHFHIVPHWLEPWIFVISGAMLALSWLMVARDCHCECDHCHGARPHNIQKVILSVVTVIFVISVVLHLMAH